jgi:hypothetical protein
MLERTRHFPKPQPSRDACARTIPAAAIDHFTVLEHFAKGQDILSLRETEFRQFSERIDSIRPANSASDYPLRATFLPLSRNLALPLVPPFSPGEAENQAGHLWSGPRNKSVQRIAIRPHLTSNAAETSDVCPSGA